MQPAQIKQIIRDHRNELAFIIGNGINRYPDNPNALSWDDLLNRLWGLTQEGQRPAGISLTELYDILDLENINDNLQKRVTEMLRDWMPTDHHRTITKHIQALNVPLLTTNFEETFARTLDYQLLHTEAASFTDFYPWCCYHGADQHMLPTDGFGIWYINGMINYHRSIRLGLSHYMGCVERARGLMQGRGNLYSVKDNTAWSGHKTWLHIVFTRSLFIIGLGLEENETFLRWLLIERSKYFKKFPGRRQKGWYLTKRSDNPSPAEMGKKFFLQKVGFEVIEVDDYREMYEDIWTE